MNLSWSLKTNRRAAPMLARPAIHSVLVVAVLWTINFIGPVSAQTEQKVFDRYARAIVKITVTGTNARKEVVRGVESSGIIFASDTFTLVLTAAHTIGSSVLSQNPDWNVTDGKIDRKKK